MMETAVVRSVSEERCGDMLSAFSRFLLGTLVALGILTVSLSAKSKTVAAEQTTFATPDAAVKALAASATADNADMLLNIFGQNYKSDLIGGDENEFRERRKILASALAEAANLRDDDVDTKTLIVGAKAWPFPFPIVRQAGVWRFDTKAGIEEVINRRIGRNESNAIELCHAT